MRPLRITIQGLRSFRSEVGIDFGDRTQIAVIGDTGAGKSSILEAMTYALYGQTSLRGGSKQELMNDTSDVMRVVLRFRVADEEWEVTRVDRRTGAGGLRPPQAQLVHYAGEETIEKVEQVRRVNERVQALIGLDSEAFLRTVILPQGRFARLLVEDQPRDRTEILRQVWRTEDLEAAGDAAAQRLSEVRILAARLQDELRRHPDEPATHLALLTSEADEANHQADTLADLRGRCIRARDTLRQSESMIAAVREVGESVIPSAMDELVDSLTPLESAQRRMQAEATELEGREVSLNRELEGIPTDDGSDHHEIARTLTTLTEMPKKVAAAVSAAGALREAISSAAEAEKDLGQAQQALELASDRLVRHQELEPPLAEAVRSADDSLRKAERWHEKCGDLQKRVRSEEDALAGKEKVVAGVTARLEAAQRDLRGAEECVQRAEQELTDARRINAAAEAAHGLCPGDECPVCHDELPEAWSPPQDTGLDAAREAHETARSQSDKAKEEVVEGAAQQQSAQQRIDETKMVLDGLHADIANALDHLRSAAELDGAFPLTADAPLPDLERVVAPGQLRFREAEAELRVHLTKAEELHEAQTNARMTETSARQAVEHLQKEIERSRNTANDALDTLHRNLQSLPTHFRPDLVLPSDPMDLKSVKAEPVDHALDAARERKEVLQARDEKQTRLRNRIDNTREELRRLEATRKTEVEEPLQAVVREFDDHRTALVRAVHELTADIVIPGAVNYPVDAETLRGGIEQLREAIAEAVALADDRLSRALADADEARSEACTVAAQLDPPVDATDLEALYRAVGDAADNARYAARTATQDRDAFAAVLDDLLELRRIAEEITALELALGDLDAALKPGAFLKWLTLRRSRDLLVYASRMLEEMTAGRYSFADPGNLEDQQWLVIDNDSGQPRSPASLSGGEQFIGSLALALGMVEMMARSGGRLESLFLDEGFGSLDRHNLDSAIEALSTVAATGRMVGVISHVGAVAEQIDDVLAVTRGTAGSQVAWLSRAQRQELALPDGGPEGASALAGLLA